MWHPDRIEKLAILNAPHPAVMMRFLRTKPRQMLRSWYMLFFQIPMLPEFLFSRDGARGLLRSSRQGAFSPEDLDRYREAWSQPGALTAMINWYRALLRERPDFAAAGSRVSVPTRILWGMKDKFLLSAMASASLNYCDDGELIEFPDATHWIHHEEPERVNRLLIEFFRP
jgi:pimeloyl-ACP methyl ester carboxylesterase